MQTSRVPAAVDALLEILRAAPGLAEVRIIDGPPPSTNLTERHRLYIGYQPDGEAAVTMTQQFANAGARGRDENFSIGCYAESRAGDKDMAIVRNRVFDTVGEVEIALRATNELPEAPTLNGTVQWANLTTGDLTQTTESGSLAGLAFTVTCRARI